MNYQEWLNQNQHSIAQEQMLAAAQWLGNVYDLRLDNRWHYFPSPETGKNDQKQSYIGSTEVKNGVPRLNLVAKHFKNGGSTEKFNDYEVVQRMYEGVKFFKPVAQAKPQAKPQPKPSLTVDSQIQDEKEGLEKAKQIFNSCKTTSKHPYLAKKGLEGLIDIAVNPYETLYLPIYDVSDDLKEIHGFQYIDKEGSKLFSKGLKKKGHAIPLLSLERVPNKIAICEGFATGVSIAATDIFDRVFCALDAGNIHSVAEKAKQNYPNAEIIVCPDNDAFKPEYGNVGMIKGHSAAKAFGLKVASPIFKDTSSKPTDFNDLHQLEGIEAVKACLLTPVKADPQPFLDSIDIILPNELDRLPSRLELANKGLTISFADSKELALAVHDALPDSHIIALSKESFSNLRRRYGIYARIPKVGKRAINYQIWSLAPSPELLKYALNLNAFIRVPKGLEAHAIRTSKIDKPDLKEAFKDDLAALEAIPSMAELPSLSLPKPNTNLLIKSPMGTGKTKNALGGIMSDVNAQGLRCLFVTPRKSLAKKLAKDFRLENYEDYNANQLPYINSSLVICFNSLWKLFLNGGSLPHFDVLSIDESEQTLKHVISESIEHKNKNFEALKYYAHYCHRAIYLDANLGKITHKFLEIASKGKKIEIIENHVKNLSGVNVVMRFDKYDALKDYLDNPANTWLANDSLKLHREIESQLSDEIARFSISSESSNDAEIRSYFDNPSQESEKVSTILSTPSAQTGLSDVNPKWEKVVGIFTGKSLANDQFQALRRARAAKEVTVYSMNRPSRIKSQLEILGEMEANASYKDAGYARNDDYSQLKSFIEADNSKNRQSVRLDLARDMLLCGGNIDYEYPKESISQKQLDEQNDFLKALKDGGLRRYIEDRLAAPRIDASQAKKLRDSKDNLSKVEMFSLQVHDLCELYAIQGCDDETLAKILELDDYGKFGKKFRNFLAMNEALDPDLAKDIASKSLLADARNLFLRDDFYKLLAKAIHLEEAIKEAESFGKESKKLKEQLETLKTKPSLDAREKRELERLEKLVEALKDERSSRAFEIEELKEFVKTHRQALERELDFESQADLDSGFNYWLGACLRNCGLKQVRPSNNSQAYFLDIPSLFEMIEIYRPRRDNCHFGKNFPKDSYILENTSQNAILASGTVNLHSSKNQGNDNEIKALEISPSIEDEQKQEQEPNSNHDEKVLARATTLVTQHGTKLCVTYLDQNTLMTYENVVTAEILLAASKSPYYRVYLTSGTTLREHGTPPKRLSPYEQWDLLKDEDKAILEALGLNPYKAERTG